MATITSAVTSVVSPAVVQLTTGNQARSLSPVTVDSQSPISSTIEWSTHSADYPEFEIQFADNNSPVSGVNLPGSVGNPVVIPVSNADVGDYSYSIIHTASDGTTTKTSGPFPFSVRSCGGCEAVVQYHLPTDAQLNQLPAQTGGPVTPGQGGGPISPS
jgi:hypothetical protein